MLLLLLGLLLLLHRPWQDRWLVLPLVRRWWLGCKEGQILLLLRQPQLLLRSLLQVGVLSQAAALLLLLICVDVCSMVQATASIIITACRLSR